MQFENRSDVFDRSYRYCTTKDVEADLNSLSNKNKSKIRNVYLSNNALKTVPPSISLLTTNLTSLRLSNNYLYDLPEWIFKFTCLEELSIGENRISKISRSIGNLVHLESLFLQHNSLTSLPSSMLKLTNLKTLYLNGNLRLPEDLQDWSFGDKVGTQAFLLDIAVEEWRKHARCAALTWILIARRLCLCGKDIARMIGQIVYASRRKDVWEVVAEAAATDGEDEPRKTKRIRK